MSMIVRTYEHGNYYTALIQLQQQHDGLSTMVDNADNEALLSQQLLQDRSDLLPMTNVDGLLIFLNIVTLIVTTNIILLFVKQLKHIARNMTLNEAWEVQTLLEMNVDDEEFKWPYDLGTRQNWSVFLNNTRINVPPQIVTHDIQRWQDIWRWFVPV